MRSITVSFRFTWEDLDNLKYIQFYFADRRYTRTDVLRMLLREARKELEAEVAALRSPQDKDYSVDYDTTLADFLVGVETENEALAGLREDSGAINPEPPLSPDEL